MCVRDSRHAAHGDPVDEIADTARDDQSPGSIHAPVLALMPVQIPQSGSHGRDRQRHQYDPLAAEHAESRSAVLDMGQAEEITDDADGFSHLHIDSDGELGQLVRCQKAVSYTHLAGGDRFGDRVSGIGADLPAEHG